MATVICVRISKKYNFYFRKIYRNLEVKFFMTLRERVRKSGENFIFWDFNTQKIVTFPATRRYSAFCSTMYISYNKYKSEFGPQLGDFSNWVGTQVFTLEPRCEGWALGRRTNCNFPKICNNVLPVFIRYLCQICQNLMSWGFFSWDGISHKKATSGGTA